MIRRTDRRLVRVDNDDPADGSGSAAAAIGADGHSAAPGAIAPPSGRETDLSALRRAYRRVVVGAVAAFVQRLNAGDVAVATVSDLERLIKLDLMLAGEPAESDGNNDEEVLSLDKLDEESLRIRLEECLAALAAGGIPPLP